VLNIIREKKKLFLRNSIDLHQQREEQLNKLADIVRSSLNTEFIKKYLIKE